MVAQQVLVLFVQVRILVVQRKQGALISQSSLLALWRLFDPIGRWAFMRKHKGVINGKANDRLGGLFFQFVEVAAVGG